MKLKTEKQELLSDLFETRHKFEDLKERMKFFTDDNLVDLSEIEEACTLIRMRKEKGLSLQFLADVEDSNEV